MATQTAKDPSQDEEFLSQLYKGGELLAAGKVVEAKEHLERAFKLHPKNEKAQNLLGLTYFKLGLFDRAAEIYELLVRENPADPTLRVNLGLVYLKTNNLPRAVKEFETSTDLEPTHKKAHNYLGLALAQSGDYARAREHFVIAGSDAMAEKMARAMAAGATAPIAVTPAPPPSAPPPPPPSSEELLAATGPPPPPPASPPSLPESMRMDEPPSFPKPSVPSFEVLTMPEASAIEYSDVPEEEEPIPEGSPIVPAELLVKPKGVPSARKIAEAATSMGGAGKPPLAQPGFEDLPPPTPSVGKALRNDWGAQFGMDEPQPVPTGDDMRFAEDEGPPSMPMEGSPVATSEAAVATGAEVPVERAEMWDGPVVEATAEEMVLEVDGPSPAQAAQAADMALNATAEQVDAAPTEAPELPPGLTFTGEPPTVDVPVSDGSAEAQPMADGDAGVAPVEMFPTAPAGDDAFATQDAWPEAQPQVDEVPAQDAGQAEPSWLTESQQQAAAAGMYEEPPPAVEAFGAGEQYGEQGYAEAEPSYSEEVPITGEVPIAASDMAMPAETSYGYAPMATPKLEEIGPAAQMVTIGEMDGPFNLSPDGLALSVNGELLLRMPGLLAVVGSLDAEPEFRRSRGRTTDAPFGQGEYQLQRVRGNGIIHLEPGGSRYQAIDLADEGAYVREERVFAFEEAVAFENARLTGQGNIGVDIVHLKGQGKVLLKLEGALKAMSIPPGTPLKVPLSRLVGWYGYVSVRVMGFVGQGAVELTGDGYVLLAA